MVHPFEGIVTTEQGDCGNADFGPQGSMAFIRASLAKNDARKGKKKRPRNNSSVNGPGNHWPPGPTGC